MKALILDGQIVDVCANAFPVHESMTWVDCPDEVKPHIWQYVDGQFVPPAPPSYASLRAAEYPDFKKYLDGIVKGDAAQVQAYIDACLAVKAKYPKPV